MSTEEVAYFDGKIPTMNQFTICYWEFIEYFSVHFQNDAAYCYTKNNDTVIQCLQLRSQRVAEDLGSTVFFNFILLIYSFLVIREDINRKKVPYFRKFQELHLL